MPTVYSSFVCTIQCYIQLLVHEQKVPYLVTAARRMNQLHVSSLELYLQPQGFERSASICFEHGWQPSTPCFWHAEVPRVLQCLMRRDSRVL